MRTVPAVVLTSVLTLVLATGCSDDRRDQIRDAVSSAATASGSVLPTSEVPTDPPSSDVPSSEPTPEPTSEAPTAEPTPEPTSEAPTAEPTSEPTSEAPTPEATAAPPETPAASQTAAAGEGNKGKKKQQEEDSLPWWVFALIAGALIALLVLALVLGSRRKGAALLARTEVALQQVAEISTHLAAVTAPGLDVVAGQDAGRLAALAAELDEIVGRTSDQARRATLAQVRKHVGLVHGLVDGVALTPGGTSAAAAAHLNEQAGVLHALTTQAQARLFPASPATPG